MSKTFEQCLPLGSSAVHEIFECRVLIVVRHGDFAKQLAFPDSAPHPKILAAAYEAHQELVRLSNTTNLLEKE